MKKTAPMIPCPTRHRAAGGTARMEHTIRRAGGLAAAKLHSLAAHPRSLARDTPGWRPPSTTLPATTVSPALTITITRYRTGGFVRRTVREMTGRIPAYLIVATITGTQGQPVDRRIADAWMTTVTGHNAPSTVHEIMGRTDPTYCYLVDADFSPVASPAELFTAPPQAA
ncbi:hypothetical protein ACFSSC_07135 [Corynebacterium mendelii]|uniref:Uncharacterized protein n=1 Tax=Corynebacterium mendelii TaxID=2765362 RepID=A0A939E3S1_9CORY|nr:hypothetical protein [Corynebacterium mendelii]MBN9644897.1 hypothetical protein [Corynebacterium mendelii]